jgi:hypothetical protein
LGTPRSILPVFGSFVVSVAVFHLLTIFSRGKSRKEVPRQAVAEKGLGMTDLDQRRGEFVSDILDSFISSYILLTLGYSPPHCLFEHFQVKDVDIGSAYLPNLSRSWYNNRMRLRDVWWGKRWRLRHHHRQLLDDLASRTEWSLHCDVSVTLWDYECKGKRESLLQSVDI